MARGTAIGLDIGTSGVRAAELSSRGGGAVTLNRLSQVALPEGAVRDGIVVDPAAVAAAIRTLWSATRFSGKRVAIGVANSRVIVRQVDLPWLPMAELRQSLVLQAQPFLPMPVEEAILDFHPLRELTGDDGARMLRGLLVAASREMVNASVAAVQQAGLRPVSVDLASFAVLRAMASAEAGGPAEALVDIGARVTNIVVHRDGVPEFVRILLMGGQDVTDALAERLGLPAGEAEALKQQVPVRGAHEPAVQAAARAIDASSASFVDEVRSSLDYYGASGASTPISRVLLSGGGALLDGLGPRLAAVTHVPVEVGTPMRALTMGRTGLSPEQIDIAAPLAAVPVGLAMGVLT